MFRFTIFHLKTLKGTRAASATEGVVIVCQLKRAWKASKELKRYELTLCTYSSDSQGACAIMWARYGRAIVLFFCTLQASCQTET